MKKLSRLFKDRDFRKKSAVVSVMLVAVFTVLLASALSLTSTPTFCNLCHEMGEDHASWRNSSHKNVTCIACHIPPNLVSFFQHKMTALPELYKHVADSYAKPINKKSLVAEELPSGNCTQCHKMENRRATPTIGIIIDHAIHLKKDIDCAMCHNRVAHPGLTKYEDFMKMDGCFRCHSLEQNAKAPGKCSACHPKDFELEPDDHKAASWLPPDHAKKAKQDREYCQMCHRESFCSNCHGMQIPHSADNWTTGKKEHAPIGRANPASCIKCHPQQDFCSACHHKGYDSARGTWIKVHRLQVDQQGASPCFDCHGLTYCAYCHVRGEKPASIKGP